MTRTRSSFSLVSPFGFVVGSCAGFSSFFFGSFAGTGIGTVGADMVGIQGYRKGGGEVIKLSVRVHRVPIWDNAYCPYVSHAHDFELNFKLKDSQVKLQSLKGLINDSQA